MRLLFAATSNQGKLKEFQEAAGTQIRVQPVPDFPNLPACVEDGATFLENARKKAAHYSALVPGLVFADDSGLEVAALGGAPGVRSARYAGTGAAADDAANNARLLRELNRLPDADRRARFVCVIALAEGGRILETFEGAAEGVIVPEPRGSGGFGYDPLFLLPDEGRTFAELSPQEKLRHSHRGRAFRALLAWLGEPQR